jgi:hypothetical protein
VPHLRAHNASPPNPLSALSRERGRKKLFSPIEHKKCIYINMKLKVIGPRRTGIAVKEIEMSSGFKLVEFDQFTEF